MFIFNRALIFFLAGIGLAACAGPASSPDSDAAVDAKRNSRSSGIAHGASPARPVESAPPRLNLKDGPRLGSTAAKIGIVEFSDYQCSFCRDFHRRQFARLKQEYIDTGVVQFIHKDLPLRQHAQAIPAAMAARCAGAQGKFWEMHDALFTRSGLDPGLYPELARQLTLDQSLFEACFKGRTYSREIGEDMNLARRMGLSGTPAFLIGKIEGNTLTITGQSSGAPAFEVFVREIEKLR